MDDAGEKERINGLALQQQTDRGVAGSGSTLDRFAFCSRLFQEQLCEPVNPIQQRLSQQLPVPVMGKFQTADNVATVFYLGVK